MPRTDTEVELENNIKYKYSDAWKPVLKERLIEYIQNALYGQHS